MADAAVKNPELLKWNPVNKRYALVAQGKATSSAAAGAADEEEGEEDEEGDVVNPGGDGMEGQDTSGRPKIPTKHNPVIVTIYGQICIAAKSYQSAICKFSHTVSLFFFF